MKIANVITVAEMAVLVSGISWLHFCTVAVRQDAFFIFICQYVTFILWLSSQNWADSVVLNEMNRGGVTIHYRSYTIDNGTFGKTDYVMRQNGCHTGTVKPRLLMYGSLWRQQVNFRQFSLFYKYQADIIQIQKKVGFHTKIFDLIKKK